MKSTFIKLSSDIDSLVNYIDYNLATKKFIAKSKKTETTLQSEAKLIDILNPKFKVFEYNSYMISLYGIFEGFLEQILEKYLEELGDTYDCYHDLPQSIQKNNLTKVNDLISKLQLPKYQELEAKKIIATLHHNLNESSTELCIPAFTHHSANFRVNSISEYFSESGIPGILKELGDTNPMNDRLKDEYSNPSSIKDDIKFSIITDLAERRNHIAHGVEAQAILQPNEIRDWCLYLKDFCDSLYQTVLSNLFSPLVENSDLKLKNIIITKLEVLDIYGGRILGFQSKNLQVKIGQDILIYRNKIPKCFTREVQGITINKKPISRCPIYIDKAVGLDLTSGISDRYSFYLIQRKNSM
ncbi:MAE_28990/MAE_18760 family HEPN-like nuclease [Vibrio cyclitrophicus]|uniref:MAE_28990/MAE_18760 family HEPN-like nuclease n=2 Tax=Vibrio TaxID=662 RepID=UPI000C847E0A|nr:MAE_28990/MAE_18760 family HEPN-like nuclease [Vibrio cyclitrophicus]MCC4773689.1 hypothetical protein [Vibrio cyclitrophicus]MCC4842009.1 hypothetical protein [Vibrio cyclitrophicus]PME13533.1 hypothetical protein BCV42_17200 [Vibrio cyclitrophicus]PME53971.1 hypothetical protein BCV37_09025 [Vibrio cyclitrophicus]PME82976.1 hypothetical protein BCV28_13605 [Vibrio cyclitrophicus]